jgi:hypothetical protein
MRISLPILAALVLCGSPAAAQSVAETCVEVLTRRADANALRRLVMDELDRHRTHRAAESDCLTFLRVELIETAEQTYVTARMNAEVPHREKVSGEDLAPAISRALRVVLHNDPVRLKGPREEDFLRRSLRSLKNGRFLFGAEVFQVGALAGEGLSTLPGVAFVARREVHRWHLGARVAFAHEVDETNPMKLGMTSQVSAQLQVSWFPYWDADFSPYVAGLMGVDHQRFRGPARLLGAGETAKATATGLGLGLRGGAELFRTTTGRVDLFAQATLPAFSSSDEEAGVVDEWVPTVTLGAGILF